MCMIEGFYKPCQSKISKTMLLNSVLSFKPISYYSECTERPLKDNHPTPLILDYLINFDIFPFAYQGSNSNTIRFIKQQATLPT